MAKIKKVITNGKTAWNVDYRTPEGRRVQKRFPKRAEAEDYLAKVRVAIKEEKYGDLFEKKPESRMIFDELADKYAEACQFDKSFKSFKAYIIPILRAEFGGRTLKDISSLDVESFRNKRRAGISKRGTQRSAARVNRELAVLKHMMNRAVRWGYWEVSPFAKFTKDDPIMFRGENKRLRYLTSEECERLLAECSMNLRPIVTLALNTGMRRGELFNLMWEHIGPKAAYIYNTKTMEPRVVPLNSTAQEVLREMRRRNHLKSSYVFCDKDGQPWKDIKVGFAGACRRAGIVNFRFHDLRHTFASHLAMNGYSMKAIADLLGHTTLTMVMRYAHLSPGHLHDAVSSLSLGRKAPENGKLLENSAPKQKWVSNLESR